MVTAWHGKRVYFLLNFFFLNYTYIYGYFKEWDTQLPEISMNQPLLAPFISKQEKPHYTQKCLLFLHLSLMNAKSL